MYLTSLLFSSFLALVAAFLSTPVLGTRIGISKKPRLLSDDGTVSADRLVKQMLFFQAKYKWTMTAMALNALQVNDPDADVQEEVVLQLTASNTPGRSAPVPLTDDLSGELWQGTIMVGTPPASYTVDFDTGSSDLFLPELTCGSSCNGHKKYNPAASSTSRDLGKTFSLGYGDGSTVSGEQYSETVAIAGLSATQQTIGAANKYSTGFSKADFPADGLMGMGFKSISTYHANPLFQALIGQGAVKSSTFAFKLAPSGAELYIGGTNTALYTPPFSYTPVTNQGYWQVNMDSVGVNGRMVLPSALSAIIDTGTTLIVGTTDRVQQVYSNIPGAKDASSIIGQGFYTVPCSAIPTLSLSFGGRAFPISKSLFNLGQVSGTENCVGGLVGSSVADNIGAWIVGDVFLQNVYTVFDVGKLQVGFAPLA